MVWGLTKQTKPEHLLVLDIGTSFVKAVLYYIDNNQVRVVSSAVRQHEPNSMKGAMVANLHDVILACKETVEAVWEDSGEACRQTIFGVNGQLIEGVTTTVHYDRAHPEQPLEHAELKNIIYKIQQRSSEKLRTSLQEKFLDDHPDIELIHASVVDVQLDGYRIENPVGFQGKRLSLTIFNAYVPLLYTSILQNVAKELGLDIVSIAALPYSISKVFVNPNLLAEEDDKRDAIFIDIGGTTTDVVVVKNGSVEGIQSFAFGGEAFTKRIQNLTGKSLEKSEDTKLEYVSGKLDKRTTAKLTAELLEEAQLWLAGVQVALSEFPDLKILPSKIYLTGGSAPLPELKRVLLTKAWTEQLPFLKKPFPYLIKPTDMWGVANLEELDLETQDTPPLCLAKLSLDLTSEQDVVTNTLQSIVRSMRE
ncbi:MAG: cell division FtsA domain-containing protein [Patescibacteria group bacterium]|nr:cell division FtsA domain-containing protein [Patescibacteria group bacterium]